MSVRAMTLGQTKCENIGTIHPQVAALTLVATIGAVRFPVVLFDLDGTVIDSGAIILASMRHAAETVVGGTYTDAELMKAVGGPGLEAQMVALDPDRVDELVTVYRAHNEPLHETLECCAGMDTVLAQLKNEGHRLGIVTAKRRLTVDLAFARLPIEHYFDVVVGGDETDRHKPDPAPLLLALERLGARAGQAAYIGDSPFDMQAARAAGLYAIGVSWGRIHRREALVDDADVIVDRAEELLAVL
jgi:pyrophosphatase PpaX